MEERSVAIDGPSGAGKSTLARMAARRFGLVYVDTGALYRGLGLTALRRAIRPDDPDAVEEMLRGLNLETYLDGDFTQRVLVNGEDVTGSLRLPEVSVYTSDISALPSVRAFLLDTQKEAARRRDVIMDGRDIGITVLPGAGLKLFLTAPPEVRAERRFKELAEKSADTRYEDVLRDINSRDKNDRSRAASPLAVASDAIILDTGGKGLAECFETLCGIICGRFGL
jgi:cytidylate kinase